MREFLEDKDPGVRATAVVTLASSAPDMGLQAARSLLGDPDPSVRAASARILGESGDPSLVGVLARAFEDPDWQVRQQAVASAASLGGAGWGEWTINIPWTRSASNKPTVAGRAWREYVEQTRQAPAIKLQCPAS